MSNEMILWLLFQDTDLNNNYNVTENNYNVTEKELNSWLSTFFCQS